MKEVVQALRSKGMDNQDVVCRYGDHGDTFYILLEGSISIWIPVVDSYMRDPLRELDEAPEESIHFEFDMCPGMKCNSTNLFRRYPALARDGEGNKIGLN